MTGRFLRALLTGLMLAGIVHIVAVLLIPRHAENDATGRVHRAVPAGTIGIIPPDGSVLPDLDPFFVHAACPFQADDRPMVVEGPVPAEYWSLAVVSRAGGIVAGFDRAAVGTGPALLTIGLPHRIEEIRLAQNGTGSGGLTVEVPPGPGFVLIRVSAADPDSRPEIVRILQAFTCQPAESP